MYFIDLDTIRQQAHALQAKMATGEYFRSPEMRRRYLELVQAETGAAMDSASPTSEGPSPEMIRVALGPQLTAELSDWGPQFDANARHVLGIAAAITSDLATAPEFEAGWQGLPTSVQAAVIRQLTVEPTIVKPADAGEIEFFEATPGGAQTIALWGSEAPRRVGLAFDRYNRIKESLTAEERRQFVWWWQHNTPRERQLMLWALGSTDLIQKAMS